MVIDWFQLFIQQLAHTGLTEWLAVTFGIIQVLLAKKNNIWLYPSGILSILLSMYLLLDVKLYAELLLNLYYLVMSVYGWMAWSKQGPIKILEITRTNTKELTAAILISTFGFAVLYLILNHFSDSDVPVWDAFVASTAWAGMWLLARRKVENWVFLNISNLFAIPLLVHKQLPMFALLTLFLFVVAIFGFIDWRKKIEASTVNELSH